MLITFLLFCCIVHCVVFMFFFSVVLYLVSRLDAILFAVSFTVFEWVYLFMPVDELDFLLLLISFAQAWMSSVISRTLVGYQRGDPSIRKHNGIIGGTLG